MSDQTKVEEWSVSEIGDGDLDMSYADDRGGFGAFRVPSDFSNPNWGDGRAWHDGVGLHLRSWWQTFTPYQRGYLASLCMDGGTLGD